jgi:hypothetical protein
MVMNGTLLFVFAFQSDSLVTRKWIEYHQARMAGGIQGRSKTASGHPPCRQQTPEMALRLFQGLGMAGPSVTLGSPWIPHKILV